MKTGDPKILVNKKLFWMFIKCLISIKNIYKNKT